MLEVLHDSLLQSGTDLFGMRLYQHLSLRKDNSGHGKIASRQQTEFILELWNAFLQIAPFIDDPTAVEIALQIDRIGAIFMSIDDEFRVHSDLIFADLSIS